MLFRFSTMCPLLQSKLKQLELCQQLLGQLYLSGLRVQEWFHFPQLLNHWSAMQRS